MSGVPYSPKSALVTHFLGHAPRPGHRVRRLASETDYRAFFADYASVHNDIVGYDLNVRADRYDVYVDVTIRVRDSSFVEEARTRHVYLIERALTMYSVINVTPVVSVIVRGDVPDGTADEAAQRLGWPR